jgi:hypothetical protein
MADSPSFELACESLERMTTLERLEARGTVRLALKAAGLEPRSVTPAQMGVVVDKVLPGELTARGVENGAEVCASLGTQLAGMASTAAEDAPEAVFARLGGS